MPVIGYIGSNDSVIVLAPHMKSGYIGRFIYNELSLFQVLAIVNEAQTS